MKLKFNKNSVIAIVFFSFIFATFLGTCYNVVKEKNTYINVYAENIGEGTGTLAKTKATALTVYYAVLNVNDKIFSKNTFINMHGFMQRIIGNRCVYETKAENTVVKLDDSSLTFVWKRENNLVQKAEKISFLNTQLKNQGIDLLYVQLPYKVNEQNKGLPAGVSDYSNENANELLAELKNSGVSTFDLREEIYKGRLDYNSLFFRTDHHWKPETGLWAANEISRKLNSNFGFEIDLELLEKDQFSFTIYEKWFLGSYGKRVGRYYTGVDDFTLVLPKYKTDMSCLYLGSNGQTFEKSGNFEQTWIFPERLQKDYFKINTFTVYSGGDYPLLKFRNNLISGKTILVLRDSFSGVLTPFLSLAACEEMHIIDPRHYEGSISEYIEDFKPDIVLMLYNPNILDDDSFFEF